MINKKNIFDIEQLSLNLDYSLELGKVKILTNDETEVIKVEARNGINPYLLTIIIGEIFEQYHYDLISALTVKKAIIELCCLYGNILFDDLSNKEYNHEIISNLNDEIVYYIDLCLAEYRLQSINDLYLDALPF